MKNQKYSVKLNDDKRKILQSFILSNSKNNTSQCKVHAKIILCLDENSKQSLTPEQIAKNASFIAKMYIKSVSNLSLKASGEF